MTIYSNAFHRSFAVVGALVLTTMALLAATPIVPIA